MNNLDISLNSRSQIGQSMKIIIVDDHILFREGLAAIICSESDIEIIGQAGTVREAIELVKASKPDMVLMDYGLPDGTGADATQAILEAYPGCNVVFITMSEEDEDLFAAIRSGAKGYLLKNMRPAKLISSLRAVERGESALSRSMTLRLMEELARTKAAPGPAEPTLTRREIEVLRELASGFSNQEIAERLFISENTVKYHVHSILEKLNISDRRDAAIYARQHRLINQD
jgi:DNA-binding NarL/FixJ family response regulator